MRGRQFQTIFLLLIAVFASGLSGCTQLGPFSRLNPFDKSRSVQVATAEDPAVEILALWQPAEGAGQNGLPTRGFAGQIFFLTRGSQSPVKVNGDVRIYLFDDLGTAKEQTKPIHQFAFEPDVWNLHLQNSLLGPCYQVFVPYVRRDPHKVNCTLSMKFKSPAGPALYSKMVSVTLPGPPREAPESEEAEEARSDAVRTAADERVSEEFSKFVKTTPPTADAKNADADDEMSHSLSRKSARSSSGSTVLQVAAASKVQALSVRESEKDEKIRDMELRLAEFVARQSENATPEADSNASNEHSASQRFRLGSGNREGGRPTAESRPGEESEEEPSTARDELPDLQQPMDAPPQTLEQKWVESSRHVLEDLDANAALDDN